VLANVFTEEGERDLFQSMGPLPEPRLDKSQHEARTGEYSGSPETFPPSFFKALNVLCDTQVFKGYTLPDYNVSYAYPPGSSFMSHFDSRYQWGETVVGVSLGAPSEMTFSYAVDKKRMPAVPIPHKHVWLPRGSIYIMSGLSRFEWKHGVFRVGKRGEWGEPLLG